MSAKDDKVRFFIVDAEDRQRSSQWFAYERAGSAYVSASILGGQFKLSLHPTSEGKDGCDSQVGLKWDYAQRELASGIPTVPPRVRWKRPATPKVGVVLVASIAFPTDYLRASVSSEDRGKRRYALPIAPTGRALVVGLFYSREKPEAFEGRFVANGITPLFYLTLPSDEYIILTAQHLPFDPKIVTDINGGVIRPLGGAPKPGESIENTHAILIAGQPEMGGPIRLIEVNGLVVSNRTN